MKDKIIISLICCILLGSCNQNNNPTETTNTTTDTTTAVEPKPETNIVGNDKDAHGCKGSAGYTWSELKKNCVRLFEDGIRLNPAVQKESAVISAFVIFSEDKKQAELFLPDSTSALLLESTSSNGKPSWVKDNFKLSFEKEYLLKLNDKEVYRSESGK
jgi:hypothetical protein